MIDIIFTDALVRIEKTQVLYPDDCIDVQDLLDNLKDQMRELNLFWDSPTLEQLERLEQTPYPKMNAKADKHP